MYRSESGYQQMDNKVHEIERRLRAVYEHSLDVIFTVDCDFRVTSISNSVEKHLGYRAEELVGRPFYDLNLLASEDLEAARKDALQALAGGAVSGSEYVFIRKDGSRVIGEVSGAPLVEDGKIIGFISIARDITGRKNVEEALRESEHRYRELSIVDGLTGLYNCRYFYSQLMIELDRSNRYDQPLTLLMIDLDDFKQFNDSYGHVEGDQVLLRLGQVIKRCLRQSDSAYRYGGEEFTVLLPMTASADAIVTAERIRMELRKETFSPVAGQDVHVTLSIGLAQFNPQEEMKGFIQRVDQFMYQAKRSGKDRVCFQLSPFIARREHQAKKQTRTKHELLEEPSLLKRRNLELEQSETGRQRAEEALQISLDQVRLVMATMARVLGSVVAARDPYTQEHHKRTSDLARAIATEMGLTRDRIDGIRIAGAVHDIGKISIPAEILSKPSKLNAAEFFLIKQHAEQGYEIMKDVESPWPLPQIVYQHHERMDGSGYPRGLKGDEIILEARVLAVADVVESMASDRPYRPTLGIAAALDEIEKKRGILYDEGVADACLRLFQEKGYLFAK